MKIDKSALEKIIKEEISKLDPRKDLFLESMNTRLSKRVITEGQYADMLIEQSNKEVSKLIQEGIFSAVGGAVKGAIQKIISQAAKMLNRALQILKTAKNKVAGMLGAIISFVERFAKQHPALFKAILAIVAIIAIAAALGVFQDAHAAVKVGGKIIDPNSAEGKIIKGVLVHIDDVATRSGNVDLANSATNLISKINSSKITDLQEGQTLTILAKKVMRVADILMGAAADDKGGDGGGGVYDALKTIYTAGKETTLEYIKSVGNQLQGTGGVGKVPAIGQQAIDAVAKGRVYESKKITMSSLKQIIKEELESVGSTTDASVPELEIQAKEEYQDSYLIRVKYKGKHRSVVVPKLFPAKSTVTKELAALAGNPETIKQIINACREYVGLTDDQPTKV